ncbi:hypothetical protein [Caballeronia novacaledonica]|uniref:Uncharacterized protein n=1 Tax=Caballeronia novacaledonica TaxID=1544861 RepID=A0AA37IIK4_9BURK|nr:hypothetical protein [Caballeronia novacaledonica]GJH29993.1 hypothetical protein CBA19CS42_35775 [Caballeronia novacaledonica]
MSCAVERVGVKAGKFADRHGATAGQLFDVVIGARHMTVLVVDHGTTEMLNDIRRHTIASIELQYSSMGKSWKTILRPSASDNSAAICSWSISIGPESGIVVPMCASGFFSNAAMARP